MAPSMRAIFLVWKSPLCLSSTCLVGWPRRERRSNRFMSDGFSVNLRGGLHWFECMVADSSQRMWPMRISLDGTLPVCSDTTTALQAMNAVAMNLVVTIFHCILPPTLPYPVALALQAPPSLQQPLLCQVCCGCCGHGTLCGQDAGFSCLSQSWMGGFLNIPSLLECGWVNAT